MRKMSSKKGIISLYLLLLLLFPPGAHGMAMATGDSLSEHRAKGTSPFALIPLGAIRFYQEFLSPQSVPACNFHPTCSHYSFQAFKKYGILRGFLLTSDRLQRCNYWARGHYPLAKDGRHLLDPVENHLLWGKPKPGVSFKKSELPECPPSGKANSYRPEGIWGFAEYLYGMKDYRRARTEYRRFITLSPEDRRAEEADFKIGICLQKERRYRLAIDHFRQWERHYPKGSLIKEARFHTGYSLFLLGDYERAVHVFTQLRDGASSKAWQSKLDYMIGWAWLRKRDWPKASLTFDRLANSLSDQDQLGKLKEIAALTQRGRSLPRRSPALAGLFSALLPGAGRAYCGRFGDAFYSFMLIAGTAYASSYYRLHHHSSQSLIFGSMGFFFYLGDIYGSIKGAEIFNEQAEGQLQDRIEKKLAEMDMSNE